MDKVRVFDGVYDRSRNNVDPLFDAEFDAEFEEKYNKVDHTWDDFQLHSFEAIRRGDDVLVSAPTSSGKSHVGWYGLKYHLFKKYNNNNNRHKIVYTAPIKTLSNEKFEEMTEYLSEYGIRPGLLTGDHRVNIESDFLIMTAEILTNALFNLNPNKDSDNKNSDNKDSDNKDSDNKYGLNLDFVNSISCVIMDEIHFISDISRGDVWENAIILLDKEVQLIGLSATIDEPESFAKWISDTRNRPISLIKKYDRPVPLEYVIFDGERNKIVLDVNGEYSSEEWRSAERKLKELDTYHKKNKTDKQGDLLYKFIDYAEKNNLMQLCFIIFSKKNCERYAEKINRSLLSARESIEAVKALEDKLGRHLKTQENLPRYQQIKKLVQKGICFHHAGMPVILKEVVEHLYKTSKIKVLFATETVAIGVNMPVRTIVFTSLEKSSGSVEDGQGASIRYLNAAEFKQICGRAGRRGKDVRGTVVFLPIYDVPQEQIVKTELLFGPMPKIKSNMDITYYSYLKTKISTVIDNESYFDRSLLKINNDKMVARILIDLEELNNKLNTAKSEQEDIIKKYNISVSDKNKIVGYIRKQNNTNYKDAVVNSTIFIKQQKAKNKSQQALLEELKKLISKYPVFTNSEKNLIELESSIVGKNKELDYFTSYKIDRYSDITRFLKTTGYIDENENITQYGVMVANINECNPFILAEIFTSGFLQDMTAKEIILLCSVLTDPITSANKVTRSIKSINMPELVESSIYFILGRIDNYRDTEAQLGLTCVIEDEEYWNISTDYIDIASIWCDIDLEKEDHSRILQKLTDLDEYEGSFIKNMLKINTIVSNLITLCNLVGNFDIIPKLEEVDCMIVKGMVNTDSLHVQI